MKTKQVAKFEIQDLLPIALTIVITGIAIVYGIDVVGDVKDDQGSCNTGFGYDSSQDACVNSTNSSQPLVAPAGEDWVAANNTLTGLAKLPEKLPTIVTVIVAAVIIGILVRYLMVKA